MENIELECFLYMLQ